MVRGVSFSCDDEYDGSLGDCDSGDDRDWYDEFRAEPGLDMLVDDAEPTWALAASEAEWRSRLAWAGCDADALVAADPSPITTVGSGNDSFGDTARTLGLFDPALLAREAAGGPAAGFAEADPEGARALLVAGVVASQRLINHFQAVQHRWIAALARPGVAVPLDVLVDVVTSGGNNIRVAGASDEDLLGDPHRLLDDPAWVAALCDGAARMAAAEIAPALSIAPRTASSKVASAVDLVDELPAVLTAHESGLLDGYRAAIIADQTVLLDPGQRAAVASAVLPAAVSRTPSRLREILKREVILTDSEAARRRATAAHEQRGVGVVVGEDDMATVTATVGIADAHLVYAVLDQAARRLFDPGTSASGTSASGTDDSGLDGASGAAGQNTEPTDTRTVAQRRADVFTDIFTSLARTGYASLGGLHGAEHYGEATAGGAQGAHRARQSPAPARTTCLNVYLDAATAMGVADNPGSIAGMGVITADTARALATSATAVRALIVQPVESAADPPNTGGPPGHSPNLARSRVCGSVVDAGRSVYVPSVRVADYVTARDATCQWPGCRTAAETCDVDHRQPYDAAVERAGG